MSSAEQRESTWTVGRLLDWTTQWLNDRHIEGGRLAAELLLARALGCRKIDLYTRYESEPSEEQRTTFRELVRQAGEHKPIAYLLGTREFFSLEFEVDPAVLIPRPETETVVQRAIEICREAPDRTWHILDVGTGSGCIAVAIGHYAANTRLVASDISSDGLRVAAANVERHDLQDRIRLVEADLVSLTEDIVPQDGFDVIVSNPPYVSEAEYPALPPNVRDHEPRSALTLDGSDGLVFYRRLASAAPAVLKPGGLLLAEIGHDQHDAVRDIFTTAGWTYVGTHRDRTDPHDRVVEVRRG